MCVCVCIYVHFWGNLHALFPLLSEDLNKIEKTLEDSMSNTPISPLLRTDTYQYLNTYFRK